MDDYRDVETFAGYVSGCARKSEIRCRFILFDLCIKAHEQWRSQWVGWNTRTGHLKTRRLRFYRRNRILHRDPRFRYRPIAGRPTSKLYIVYFPTFLSRFFNITKRFSKKRSTHLENEYSVTPYHMEPFCQDYKTLFEEMFDSSRNCIQCISLPFWIVFFNVTKRFWRNIVISWMCRGRLPQVIQVHIAEIFQVRESLSIFASMDVRSKKHG